MATLAAPHLWPKRRHRNLIQVGVRRVVAAGIAGESTDRGPRLRMLLSVIGPNGGFRTATTPRRDQLFGVRTGLNRCSLDRLHWRRRHHQAEPPLTGMSAELTGRKLAERLVRGDYPSSRGTPTSAAASKRIGSRSPALAE
jgi:hypothetical protein